MLQGQLAAFQRATLNIVSQARGVACEIVTPFDESYAASPLFLLYRSHLDSIMIEDTGRTRSDHAYDLLTLIQGE